METVARKPRGARFEAAAEVFWREADAMHALLVKRADELIGCTEGSPEEEELRALADVIADVIEAYEAKRWPSRKAASGKLNYEGRMTGTYQIVWISELTGEALPFEDDMTLDDVEWWVDENAVKDEEQ